ncbi:hypothetical protein JZ751_012597 [Albula glossodonta]|uniref:Uncharacterized protein n=1 Tax=Albula glossodonta TaxID=121402 RepID=A0A8T2NUV4_9TELE|nr:hypothetical protein JZ751_012597 [Albula glossodonta]
MKHSNASPRHNTETRLRNDIITSHEVAGRSEVDWGKEHLPASCCVPVQTADKFPPTNNRVEKKLCAQTQNSDYSLVG